MVADCDWRASGDLMSEITWRVRRRDRVWDVAANRILRRLKDAVRDHTLLIPPVTCGFGWLFNQKHVAFPHTVEILGRPERRRIYYHWTANTVRWSLSDYGPRSDRRITRGYWESGAFRYWELSANASFFISRQIAAIVRDLPMIPGSVCEE